MIKTLKAIIRKGKELWNVYGGIALSTFIAWLTHWDKVEMDKWASYLILTLTCISVLTFFKIVLFRKKKKKTNRLDKGIFNANKNVKRLRTAINPMSIGQEVGNAIIYTCKGGKWFMGKVKNFFKELWGNKFTLLNTIIVLFLATLSQVMTYTEYLYRINWFAENEIVIKIASPIVAGIWVFVDLLTTYTKYGFESLEDLAKRKEEKKLASLSKEEKSKLKDNVKELKNTLEILKDKEEGMLKTISKLENLMSAGYSLNMNEREEYESNRNQITNVQNTIANLEDRIKQLEEEL